jgi:large subunit ribosomal protein L17
MGTKVSNLVNDPHGDMEQILKVEAKTPSESFGVLRDKTRWNLQKLLKYRNSDALAEIATKASSHMARLATLC